MNSQTLTRKELYDLVWSTPFTTLAKKYAISDTGLRKICMKMNIPFPKSGHWSKLQFNKTVEIVKLPTDYSGANEVSLNLREKGDNTKGFSSPITSLEQEIITKEGKDLIVPDKLTNPDKLIIAAREALTKKDKYQPREGLIGAYGSGLSICVTPENIGRALRFMDTFIKVIRNRGHQINTENRSSSIIILDEKMEINLREKLKRIPKPSRFSWQEYDYVPTGILSFNAKINFYNVEWKDGKLPIEKQLAKIIARLEINAQELREQTIQREKRWAAERVKQLKEEEIKKRKGKELDDFRALLKNAKQWQEAELLRDYINEVEAKAKANNDHSDKTKNWIIWARKKADWYDPQTASEDELLNENDKENLVSAKKANSHYLF